MKKLLTIAILLPLMSVGQNFAEFHIGATSRLGITGYGNIGRVFLNRPDSGPLLAATAGYELGMGFNAGAYAGWQWYGISFYGGATHFASTNSKLVEGSRIYPMAGVQFKWDNITFDTRYMGDAIHLAAGVRF